MSGRPEYIKCAIVAEAEDPDEEYEFVYEVKWVGRPDHPDENTWEREAAFSGPASEIIEKFWESGPEPTSQPNDEGRYALKSRFEAPASYIAARARLFAAAQLGDHPPRSGHATSTPAARAKKRSRSRTNLERDQVPSNRRRQESPTSRIDKGPEVRTGASGSNQSSEEGVRRVLGQSNALDKSPAEELTYGSPATGAPVPPGEYRPPFPRLPVAPRPMIRPTVGSVLTFKKGKAVVQDRHGEVQDARLFRVRGGLFLQQHLRKEREQRLHEARKRVEEAKRAAEEEARRTAEELAEAEAIERMAEAARIEEENARIKAEADERAARAAQWNVPLKIEEPAKSPSPPPLKDLLASALEGDDLPDFEDDEIEATPTKPQAAPPPSIFGAPTSLLSGQAKASKKNTDPYYWAKKLDEERRQKELLSRHPTIKLEVNGAQVQLFIKDILNEPPRSSSIPSVSIVAGSIIDTVSTEQEVDTAITYIECGWSPARSVGRLAPVSNTDWPLLDVLALQLLVDGKVIISSENGDGWRPIIFASEEEGLFGLLGAPKQLANYKSTLLISILKNSAN